MEKHFHEVEGRTLFFFPAASMHKDGSWVFVAFSSGGSCCLFRGRVRTQDSARFVGSWVEFPITGMATLLKHTSQSRRTRERLAADVTVMLRRSDGAKALCRIADVSAEGAGPSRLGVSQARSSLDAASRRRRAGDAIVGRQACSYEIVAYGRNDGRFFSARRCRAPAIARSSTS